MEITGITGITSVLPLKTTVLPVVIPPNFTTDFHWYTTGKFRDIFYGEAYVKHDICDPRVGQFLAPGA